jgi:MFS family permease
MDGLSRPAPGVGNCVRNCSDGALLVGAAVVGRSFVFALLGSAVMGYGSGAGQLARLAAADMYPVRERAQAVSYVLMGAAVGAILGPIARAAVERLASANRINPIAGPWFVFSAVFVVGVLAVVLVRPDPRTIAIRVAELAEGTPGLVPMSSLRTRHNLLRMRPVWVAIVAIAALETTMVMIVAIVPLGMADLGYSLPLVSTLIAVQFAGMFGLSIPIGWVADRLGRKPVLLTGCLNSALGCLMIGSGSAVWLVGGGFYCVGLGWSLTYLTAATILADVTHPYERAGLIGIMDFSVAIGGATASLAGGEVYGLAGLPVLGFLGMAFTVPPFLAGLRLHERKVGVYGMSGADPSSRPVRPAAARP